MRTPMNRLLLLTAALSVVALTSSPARAEEGELAPLLRGALVKVHATTQSWDSDSPWNKGSPRGSEQRGVVVRPGLVLTPAGGLANLRMVELSVANSARRYPASLVHIDYAANLALLKIDDPGLLAQTAPIPLGDPITIDDEFEIWELGSNDLVERSTGLVKKAFVSGCSLHLTVKTNLSDSGNGQVALKDGKVVGLVIQTRPMSQEGRLIALETLRHYLEDYDSGNYRGFGSGPLFSLDLLRDDLRDYFGVPKDVHGIVVTRVIPGRTGSAVLQKGDVIASIAGHDLDDEGMFLHPLHGRLSFWWLLTGTTHPGDEVGAKIYRQGKAMDVKITIHDWPASEQRVPSMVRDRPPAYIVTGGLVILELTGRESVDSYLLERYQERAHWDPPSDRKRIVYASRVLSDESNKGLDTLAQAPIDTVNGMKITRIQDVIEALKHPQGGYQVFLFEGLERPFVIPADQLGSIDSRIAERYRIPKLIGLPAPEDDSK